MNKNRNNRDAQWINIINREVKKQMNISRFRDGSYHYEGLNMFTTFSLSLSLLVKLLARLGWRPLWRKIAGGVQRPQRPMTTFLTTPTPLSLIIISRVLDSDSLSIQNVQFFCWIRSKFLHRSHQIIQNQKKICEETKK